MTESTLLATDYWGTICPVHIHQEVILVKDLSRHQWA